ncbi:MAG: GNAT family N-acetyltransferase [Lachnospiraceae bacterium]
MGKRGKQVKTEEIRIQPAYDHPEDVRALFSEYTEMLAKGDPAIREYLAVQNYEKELEHLEEKYGPPEGRLYLAYVGETPAGCIGLRKIDGENCEMKRLYVRPAYRGRRIGALLVERVLKDAEDIGYRYMLLDTLPFLQNAVRLYKRYGFHEIPRYNNSPMNTGIYMKRELEG